MNMEIVTTECGRFKFDERGTAYINIEDAARGLGFTEVKNGVEYVRWRTINAYLKSFGFSQLLAKDDFIPENMFYRLAMKANNEAANNFQARVANEILPNIRKDGVYLTPQAAEKILLNPDFIIKLAQQVKDARAERDAALAQVAELKPDAEYCRNILQSKGGIPVTIIAKDYGMSGMTFNELLRTYEIQHKVGRTWVLNQKYVGKGYTETQTVQLRGGFTPTVQMLWTQKGRNFLYNELKRHGVLPLSERETLMTPLLFTEVGQ